MKFLPFALLMTLVFGCSKKDSLSLIPDNRTQYIGIYDIAGQTTLVLNANGGGQVFRQPLTDVITVSKGPTDNQLLLTTISGTVTATLNGGSFTIQPISLTVPAYGGGTTQGKLTEGSGSFDATTLTIKTIIVADYGTTTNTGSGKRR